LPYAVRLRRGQAIGSGLVEGSIKQLFADAWPAFPQVVREFIGGHAIDAGAAAVGLYSS
jgi:hypothetical protein